MLSVPFYGLHHSFRQPIWLRVIWWCFIWFTLYFFNRKLRSSSQYSGALLDTRVFGMLFLENMTLRICFIIELFLSGIWITSGQTVKEFTRINKSSIPVMYAWSICRRHHGSTSLGHECKVVCVKFLKFLNFFIFLCILWHLVNVLATVLLILSFFFLCSRNSTRISSCTLFITNFLCVSGGNYHIPITNHSIL